MEVEKENELEVDERTRKNRASAQSANESKRARMGEDADVPTIYLAACAHDSQLPLPNHLSSPVFWPLSGWSWSGTCVSLCPC